MASRSSKGTVVPKCPFSAETAAAELRKAMKGMGTDEAKIIEVLASHSNQQRQEILVSYKTQYGKDLKHELKSELGGKFEDVVLALMETPANYDAHLLHSATKGLGTKEGVLIEILCSRSVDQIKEIIAAYKTLYKKKLEDDITGDTSGCLKRLLVSQLTGGRDQCQNVDPAVSAAEAKAIYEAGENKIGTDESEFNRVLSLKSYPQLVAIFDAYKANYKKDIEQVIKSETSGYIEDGFLAIVAVARNPAAYFAERLYKSMKGAGTNDKQLIRCVVTRCEVDMVEIKEEFRKMYKGKTLESFISDDVSGDYKRMLLALVKDHRK